MKIKIVDSIMTTWTIGTTVIYTTVIGLATMVVALFSKTGKLSFHLCRLWAWLVLKTNRIQLSIEGLENIVKNRSYVFISNHSSLLDPPAAALALPHTLRFVAKQSLSNIPVFGWATKLARMIYIDRESGPQAFEKINRTVRELKDGISAYFFAEGTRSDDGLLKSFKKGGVMLAMQGKLPIVPVTIVNSHDLMPKKALRIKPGIIRVIIGRPIETAGLAIEEKDRILEATRAVIENNLRIGTPGLVPQH